MKNELIKRKKKKNSQCLKKIFGRAWRTISKDHFKKLQEHLEAKYHEMRRG